MKPVKLNRTITQIQNLILKFHVRFIDSNNVFHKDFDYKDAIYSTTNYPSYVTMEIFQGKDSVWDSNKTVILTTRNIFSVVKAFDMIIKNIYENDIFAIKNGAIVAYSDEVKKNIVQVNIPFTSNVIQIVPCVVYDESGVSYEGARVFINNSSNGTDLTIDSLEATRSVLSRIDFFVYTQLLVNYYVMYYRINDSNPVSTKTGGDRTRKSINWTDQQNTTKAESKSVKNNTDNEFNELMNM